MGMLAAVEMWTRRDHDAEWDTWKGWLGTSSQGQTASLSITVDMMPEDLSNHSPRLRIKWDGNTLKITGDELAKTLDEGTPRIQFDELSGTRPDQMESSLTIMPYMMMPGMTRSSPTLSSPHCQNAHVPRQTFLKEHRRTLRESGKCK